MVDIIPESFREVVSAGCHGWLVRQCATGDEVERRKREGGLTMGGR
jgi:hypothetical protein